MDRKSGKHIKKVPLSGWANDAAVTSDGKLILVCIRNTGTKAEDVGALDIIDAKSLEKVKSIPTKRGLHDMAVTGDGKYAAAGSPGDRRSSSLISRAWKSRGRFSTTRESYP